MVIDVRYIDNMHYMYPAKRRTINTGQNMKELFNILSSKEDEFPDAVGS